MEFIEILYITIAVAVVVLTVTVVWLSNELISLIKSVKRSSRDSEKVTKEIKEKVLLVSESLDRAGSAASSLVGLMEDAVEGIKPRRDKIADSLAVISGAGKYARTRQAEDEKVPLRREVAKKDKEKNDQKTNPKSKQPEAEVEKK